MKLRNSKGFTLIELVMVIVILGILSAIAIPKFVDLTGEAKINATKSGLGAVRSVIAIEYAKTATSGTASFPSNITTDLFADERIPTNKFNDSTSVGEVGSAPSGTATSANGWWYISASGIAGAYSDGTEDTSAW
ncbi:MAG: prepilin-type N-terminal cleavage/methylation domain-containing protein [Candidatus Omnitrophica bacterium]|nr:prepilin-type N-terminal cleavage/methylation domain-containing protein [Candidatus Omnitrophota bacterium]